MKGEHRGHVDRARALEVLKRYWGHPDFRPGQWEVIQSILEGRDVLAVLPTGTGKSVCYQLPALLDSGLTLVVSPLIALMRDQVDGLRRRGIGATSIDSTLSSREIDQRLTDSEFGKYRMLYVAPERLESELFRVRSGRLDIRRVVVDEAHCVSEWGHSFRPAYLGIAESVGHLERPVMAALTATATPRVRSDIVSLLGLRSPATVVTGFDRPNIEWSVFRDEHKRRRVLSMVHGVDGSVVVYAGTRRGTEEWDAWLRSCGVSSVHYHGGLAPAAREAAQRKWMEDVAPVIVATSAFGMGIDKPDVRHVIHVDLPMSLEAYYQEAGRAGRDGDPARATIVYQEGDDRLPRALIDSSFPTAEQVARVYEATVGLAQVAVGSVPDRPLDVDVRKVARLAGITESTVNQSVDYLERIGAWASLPTGEYGYLRVKGSTDSLRTLLGEEHPELIRSLVDRLLRRVVADSGAGWTRVRRARLARHLGTTDDRLESVMRHLEMTGLIEWRGPGSTLRLALAGPRPARVPVRAEILDKSRKSALSRLEDLLRYIAHRGCRRNFILTYFGESTSARCGRCDNCSASSREASVGLDWETLLSVLTAVASGTDLDTWAIEEGWTPEQIDESVDWLTREGYLRVARSADFRLELTERAKKVL